MRALIFDMDGVIIDSEPLWLIAERQVFAEVGLELSDADCERTMGMRTDEVINHWYARSVWRGPTPEEVERRLTDQMQDLITTKGVPMPGLSHALAVARDAKFKLALASSSSPRLIETALIALDLTTTFEVVRSAIHEEKGKPHPAVYLATARELGVRPENCTAIEDSVAGVTSALAAGMRVIAIPPPHLFGDPSYDQADIKVHSLEELTPEMLGP